jgi:hypothetical protein
VGIANAWWATSMTEFRRVADTPGTDALALRIGWARIPVLWWRDVTVLVAEPVELSILDRFAVESARRLGCLTAGDFLEFTGLPDMVFAALARRLHTLDLIEWRGDALLPNGRDMDLDEISSTTRTTTNSLDFLYLPESDDLVAITDGLGEFERAWPRRSQVSPLPERLHAVSRRELLATRIADRTVVGLPASVVGLADTEQDEPLTAMAGASPDSLIPVCPAFECSALVIQNGGRTRVSLDIGKRRSRRGKDNGDGVPVTLDLGRADGLVAVWQQVAAKIGARENRPAVLHAVAKVELDPRQLRFTPDQEWSLGLTGPQAEELAKRGPLTEPVGIEVRDEHAHVSVAIRLTPADAAAERIFALDSLISGLLARPKEVLEVITEQSTLVNMVGGPQAVWRRAWALGHFWIAHRLREQEDFDYA